MRFTRPCNISGMKTVVIWILSSRKCNAFAGKDSFRKNRYKWWTVSALQLHRKGIIVCDYDACSDLRVGTYKYFLDIEHDNLDPDSLLD